MDEGRGPSRRPRPRPTLPPTEAPLWRRLRRTTDIYYRLLTVSWRIFFALIALAYLLFNGLFAVLYRLQDGSIANAARGFADAFFFSVQTMATIGYGDMRPATLYANWVVTIEVLLGMVGFALATGVIFARFSRPTARAIFSRNAVIVRHDGKPTLMFRVANQRSNRILEAQIGLTLARNEVTVEGHEMRRFHELRVERGRTPLLMLTWTVLHVIDDASPLHGATPQILAAREVEVIASIVGFDETLAQTIHARHSYDAADILFGRRLSNILTRGKDGATVVDYSGFHETVE